MHNNLEVETQRSSAQAGHSLCLSCNSKLLYSVMIVEENEEDCLIQNTVHYCLGCVLGDDCGGE